MMSPDTFVLFILLMIPIIVIWDRQKKGLSLEKLEKVAIYLDIIGVLIFIMFTAIDKLSPFLGSQITIPSELSQGILIVLLMGIIITAIIHIRHRRYIERIDCVEAFIFFPKNTPEENKTLDYHKEHYHKKLIVNFKLNPPQAYYLHASNKSYGWQLIQKYHNMWCSVEDTIYPNPDTTKWCAKKGYHPNTWDASKKELLKSYNLSFDVSISKLSDSDLDEYKIIFLYPWYTFTLDFLIRLLYPSEKRVLLKISTSQAFEPPFWDINAVERRKLHSQTFIRKPFESIGSCLKRYGYTFVREQCTDDVLHKINQ